MAHGLKIQHGLESIIRGWSFKRHKSLFSGSTNCKQLLLYSRVVYLSGNPVSTDLNGNWIHATINCLFPLSLLIWEWIITMETQTSCRAIRICTSPSCLPAVDCLVGPRPEVFAQKGPRPVSIRKKRKGNSLEYFTELVIYNVALGGYW